MMCVEGYDGESTEDMGADSRSMGGGVGSESWAVIK